MQQVKKEKSFSKRFFDISFILYYVAYVFYYEDYTPYNGTIRDIATILLLISGALLIRSSWRFLRPTSHLRWYGIFILFSMLSSLWARDSSIVISAFPTMARILVVGYFLYFRITDEEDVEDVCDSLIVGTIYIIIAVIIRMINRYSLATFYLFRIGDGVGSNSNAIAILSLFMFFLAFHKFKIKRMRILNTILMASAIIIILISQSKKAIFSLLLGLIIEATINRGQTAKRYVRIIGALVLAYVMYQALMTVPQLYEIAGFRIEEMLATLSGNSLASHSTFNRQELIRQGIEMWKNNPILGVGLNNFSILQTVQNNSYYSHNNYVEMLSCLGIIGFAIYYSFPFWLVFGKDKANKSSQSAYTTFKTLIILILLMDVAVVSFETLQIQVIIIIFSIIKHKQFTEPVV